MPKTLPNGDTCLTKIYRKLCTGKGSQAVAAMIVATGGTAFEVGFFAALGRPVLAYSHAAQSFRARLEALYQGRLGRRADGTQPIVPG